MGIYSFYVSFLRNWYKRQSKGQKGEKRVQTSVDNIVHDLHHDIKFENHVKNFLQNSVALAFFLQRQILKLVSAIFLSIFHFSPNDSPSKTMKNVFFHLKSYFHSQDIQIFVLLSSPLFFPLSHCLRGWSKKNLKIYDIINCLNKSFIYIFIYYILYIYIYIKTKKSRNPIKSNISLLKI